MIFSSKESALDNYQSKALLQTLKINNVSVENYDSNTINGSQLAQTYGVMDYPAVVIVSEDGSVRGFWQGNLPSDGEVSQAIGYI